MTKFNTKIFKKKLEDTVAQVYAEVAERKKSPYATKSILSEKLGKTGIHEYGGNIYQMEGIFRIGFSVSKTYDLIEDFLRPHYNDLNLRTSNYDSITSIKILMVNPLTTFFDEYSFDAYRMLSFDLNARGLETFKLTAIDLLKSKMLPFAKKFDDIRFFDSIVNREIVLGKDVRGIFSSTDITSIYRRLIVAKLADSTNFSLLCAYYEDEMTKLENQVKTDPSFTRFQHYPRIFHELVKVLDQTPPLSDPDLFGVNNRGTYNE